ncbi:hypothetical protein PTTG_28347 [Puccinia triticina 1-1 BBBD Race 1]|uniref:Uncharacterized protein n=1 Tax=Puccinia triticina (isolate 1-1 / race 1 (BBBD)) TaxID=630390 RepID=A0A180GCE6_PUCT1|nr:hypothetical protein PTTG_28347 [Puccinia triticina 1-1 BBBD Race 1]
MKACQGFIYLVSLFVLVTGVWSALPLPKDKIVPLYSHTWEPKTAEMGLQKQYLKGNNTPFSSRVLVKEIEVEGKKGLLLWPTIRSRMSCMSISKSMAGK